MPKAHELTNEQIKEAQAIDLDAKVKDGGRMSLYNQAEASVKTTIEPEVPDEVAEDDGQPINLDDIPF